MIHEPIVLILKGFGFGNNDGYGYQYTRFLSFKKEPDSAMPFLSISSPNGDYLIVQAKHWVNIPPRQLAHWAQHEIPASQIQLDNK
jgi:hypothetical protein